MVSLSTASLSAASVVVVAVVDVQDLQEEAQEAPLHGSMKEAAKAIMMTSLPSPDSATLCQSLIKRRVSRALPIRRPALTKLRLSLTLSNNLSLTASVSKVASLRDSSVQTTRRLAATKQQSVLFTEVASESILTTARSQAGEAPASDRLVKPIISEDAEGI